MCVVCMCVHECMHARAHISKAAKWIVDQRETGLVHRRKKDETKAVLHWGHREKAWLAGKSSDARDRGTSQEDLTADGLTQSRKPKSKKPAKAENGC